jgi:hypothetical protein
MSRIELVRVRLLTLVWLSTTAVTSLLMPGIGLWREDTQWQIVLGVVGIGKASRGEATTTDPHWYRDAVIYSCHVRSFQDSNGDGFGDFAGLARRLPYVADLGVTCLWLAPFFPSPLRDDGYDVSDYLGFPVTRTRPSEYASTVVRSATTEECGTGSRRATWTTSGPWSPST